MTYKVIARNSFGTVVEITFDAAYVTGGESVTFSQLGEEAIQLILFENSAGYSFQYDAANKKILAYVAAGTEAANDADLHAIKIKALVIGY